MATSCLATVHAEIAAVPQNEAGYVLTPLNIWIAAALTLGPIPLGLIGGIKGLALAISLYSRSPPAAALAGLIGIGCGFASLVVLVSFQHALASRFLRWRANRAFTGRLEPLVRPDDPDAEFVDFLPRSHWGYKMLEPAIDIGFFKIEHRRRELLFEGDLKRYRIPFESVTACQVEDFTVGREQWEVERRSVTVLTFGTSTGPREVPLVCRQLDFTPRGAAERRAQADDLCNRILTALNGHV